MKILDLCRSKHKNSNPLIRIEALSELTNQKTLDLIVKEDPDMEVRKEAVKKITDNNYLIDIIHSNINEEIRKIAAKNIDDQEILAKLAKTSLDWFVRKEAIKKLDNQKIIGEIARKDKDRVIREEAAKKITEQSVLAEIFRTDTDFGIRKIALEKIEDQDFLAKVAQHNKNQNVRETALKKLNDQNILANIARSKANPDLRKKIVEKLDNQEVLIDIATNEKESHIRKAAFRKVTDNNFFLNIVKNKKEDYDLRETALEHLTDQNALSDIAINCENPDIRKAAALKITDLDDLTLISETDKISSVRKTALGKIEKLKLKLKLKPSEPETKLECEEEDSQKKLDSKSNIATITRGKDKLADKEKILIVDDDSNILNAYRRGLCGDFNIITAINGNEGLVLLNEHGPFAVAISDMKMPGMNGNEFLFKVKEEASDTVRMIITGYANLENTIHAVNDGNVFRFLTKPCSPEVLKNAFLAGIKEYHTITKDKELLASTLRGSVKLLLEMLSQNDKALEHGLDLRKLMRSMKKALKLPSSAIIDLAAVFSQIGYSNTSHEILSKHLSGNTLSFEEQKIITAIPKISYNLIKTIPRLEPVARIVLYQNKNFDGSGFPNDSIKGKKIPLGARILRVLTDLSEMKSKKISETVIRNTMQNQQGKYDPDILETALSTAFHNKENKLQN